MILFINFAIFFASCILQFFVPNILYGISYEDIFSSLMSGKMTIIEKLGIDIETVTRDELLGTLIPKAVIILLVSLGIFILTILAMRAVRIAIKNHRKKCAWLEKQPKSEDEYV